MRRFVLSLTLSLLAGTALAQRPSTLGMSCGEAQALVAQAGAIVLSTGQHTYDRYVAHFGYCLPGEFLEREWVPTADGQCRLRVCRNQPRLWFEDF
jgi:hypothetical protein